LSRIPCRRPLPPTTDKGAFGCKVLGRRPCLFTRSDPSGEDRRNANR